MLRRICNLLRFKPDSFASADDKIIIDQGNTVPTDGTAGYAIGAIFLHRDGGEGTALYVNEGTESSCDFNAVSALTATQEALIGATAGTLTASKAIIVDSNKHVDSIETASLKLGATGATTAVTATAAELNQLDGNILDDMTEGTGISGATGEICEHRVSKVGGLYKTEILIDLTGLNSGGTAGDIIGKDGETANCHIGQITAAKNGTIVAGRVTCFETPSGGDPDIDIFSATEATGAQDAAIGDLTETKLIDHGDWTAEDVDHLSATPAADEYLYLACGAATDADYTAGILLIELWGK